MQVSPTSKPSNTARFLRCLIRRSRRFPHQKSVWDSTSRRSVSRQRAGNALSFHLPEPPPPLPPRFPSLPTRRRSAAQLHCTPGLPEAQARGYKAGRFSFNVKGGRCEACQGDGVLKIEMHFLPDVYVACDQCKGKRYNRETLEILYKGKSIADVLEMTVDDAYDFFQNIPSIRDKCELLKKVGLGYIQLGQSATTLSGGEAQRIKLAKELSKRATGKTLYILDEPTTGLHFADIQKLLDVLEALVEQGNTVVVIEHNLDVIKTADYLIDLGPDGGDKGGHIVVTGTPEEVAQCEKSYTGQYLKRML